MRITKQELMNVIEKLESCVELMEDKDIEEITTQCNTYGMSEFISFGRNGYLSMDNDVIEIDNEE